MVSLSDELEEEEEVEKLLPCTQGAKGVANVDADEDANVKIDGDDGIRGVDIEVGRKVERTLDDFDDDGND